MSDDDALPRSPSSPPLPHPAGPAASDDGAFASRPALVGNAARPPRRRAEKRARDDDPSATLRLPAARRRAARRRRAAGPIKSFAERRLENAEATFVDVQDHRGSEHELAKAELGVFKARLAVAQDELKRPGARRPPTRSPLSNSPWPRLSTRRPRPSSACSRPGSPSPGRAQEGPGHGVPRRARRSRTRRDRSQVREGQGRARRGSRTPCVGGRDRPARGHGVEPDECRASRFVASSAHHATHVGRSPNQARAARRNAWCVPALLRDVPTGGR